MGLPIGLPKELQGSVALILTKLDELIRAVGGKIETFYPYVVRQVVIIGAIQIFFFVLSIVCLSIGLPLCLNKKNWECSDPNGYGILGMCLAAIGGIVLLVSLINFAIDGIYFLNPNYFAVRNILEIGKNLLGK